MNSISNDFLARNLSAPFRNVMKFHLIYKGPLSSSGNSSKPKAALAIREQLHSQMELLWQVHSSLVELKYSSKVPKPHSRLSIVADTPLLSAEDQHNRMPQHIIDELVDLCEPIDVGGHKYIPLIRKSLSLNCSLKILFLRQEDPGALISKAGDIDNRIKTLLDGLKIPDKDTQDRHPPKLDPTYCLLESDFLVSDLDIDTDRLLFPETKYPNEVHLVVEVKVNVLRAGLWNLCLL